MKLYFATIDSETCHSLEYHMQDAKMQGLQGQEIELYEAVPEPLTDYFWCRAYGTVGEKGNDYDKCGKECKEYSPCNGKSGRCRYMGKTYTHSELKTFKVSKK